MSYEARGSGRIKLKSNCPEKVKNLFEQSCKKWSDSVSGWKSNTIGVEIWLRPYYDEYIWDSIATLEPYTEEGSIRFTGEDGNHWEMWFDRKENTWREEEAYIAWPSETLTDYFF